MSLAVGKKSVELNESDFVDIGAACGHWNDWPASALAHHGADCCRVARAWLLSMDYSLLGGASVLTGPRWIRHKYTWGPSNWPLHWCEAVRQKTLDCGALAALAHEVFVSRGVRSFPAQFVQQFSDDATRDWHRRWQDADTTVKWIKEDLIYHEGCAVAAGGDEIKVWDASAGWWINPKQFGGYGGLLAVRIFDAQAGPDTAYKWGEHRIAPNVWEKVERARGDFA